jgi:hypothetical protein
MTDHADLLARADESVEWPRDSTSRFWLVADLAAALRAEIEKRDEYQNAFRLRTSQLIDLRARAEAAEARIVELEADARRYRYLRDDGRERMSLITLPAHVMDAAIDAIANDAPQAGGRGRDMTDRTVDTYICRHGFPGGCGCAR